jgi:prepilin-type N-terminal cleavage/methylation domain-containing protein
MRASKPNPSVASWRGVRALPAARGGFSLLELIVAVGILAALVGVVAANSSQQVGRGRSARILQLVDALRTACAAHRIDTCEYALELAGYPAQSRMLTAQQTMAGWKGPYLDQPLGAGQNPWGGRLDLFDDVRTNGWIDGFDIDADGTLDVTGSANMLVLTRVPTPEALALDSALEKGIPGEWMRSGRVRYDALEERLFVLVYY